MQITCSLISLISPLISPISRLLLVLCMRTCCWLLVTLTNQLVIQLSLVLLTSSPEPVYLPANIITVNMITILMLLICCLYIYTKLSNVYKKILFFLLFIKGRRFYSRFVAQHCCLFVCLFLNLKKNRCMYVLVCLFAVVLVLLLLYYIIL